MSVQPAQAITTQRAPELQHRVQQVASNAIAERAQAPGSAETRGADATTLSEALLEELNQKGTPAGADVDSIVASLKGVADSRLDQEQPGRDPQGVQGVEKAQKPQKRKKAHWTPEVQRDDIIPGRDVIGRIEIREETTTGENKGSKAVQGINQAGGANGAATGGAGAAGAGAAGAAAIPPAGPASEASSEQPDQGKDEDRAEMSPEAQQIAGQAQAQGLQVAGGLQNAAQGNTEAGSYEVRTRATGVTHTVDVQAAGDLAPGSVLRHFQRLDDSPLLSSATTHKVKGSEVAGEIERDGKRANQPGSSQLVQKLKNPQTEQ